MITFFNTEEKSELSCGFSYLSTSATQLVNWVMKLCLEPTNVFEILRSSAIFFRISKRFLANNSDSSLVKSLEDLKKEGFEWSAK